MALTQQQLKKAHNWLNSKTAKAVCPSCGAKDWAISDHMIGTLVHGPEGFVIPGGWVAMVRVICQNCAYVRLHDAYSMGLKTSS